MDCRIKKEKGYFDLTPVFKAVTDVPDGEYTVSLKKYRKQRTDPQNAYLWAAVYPAVLKGLTDAGWDEITDTGQVHEILKARFLTKEAVNKHTGEIVSFPMSTAKMDTLQFATYIEQIADFARQWLNITLPEPEL